MSPRIAYKNWNPAASSWEIIDMANEICETYRAQGFDLTLRQLYYQFIARDFFPNNERSYNRLGSIVNDARMAGLMDWNFITDRTRAVREPATWEEPSEIIRAAASSYAIDLWEAQPDHVEVWVEKDALVGVIARACDELALPYLSCRGYVSQSECWRAGQRLLGKVQEGKSVTILHLGDHDPSGIDMSRDIEDRLWLFIATGIRDSGVELEEATKRASHLFTVDRIALNWDQIEEYSPPPNPAKITDSRSGPYIAEYGRQSWELDALEPRVLADLIDVHARQHLDVEQWEKDNARQEQEREVLTAVASQWDDVSGWLKDGGE